LFKKAVVSCHRFITEADAGTFYYFSSAIRCGKIFTAGITEVPYFIILFINLLVTIRLLCIHDHTGFRMYGSSTLQADNHAFGFSFLEKC
jgi:hypothetical protein